ncbi:MAG TPA: DUF6600 domain-containing protein [Ramlibacter sp.]|nr:DUF6600 domain-containing protein [Ramlibacter sp.]
MTTARFFHPPTPRFLSRCFALAALLLTTLGALAQADPPARVGGLSHLEGSVAYASAGETGWSDAVLNRPITQGDRVFTDPGARAEVHLGSASLHLDSQTFLEVVALDDDVLQASLHEGVVNARVRQLLGGENFEIDTPQLAFRALQPGDYRIDVDPAAGTTRVTVRSGVANVYGAGGGALQLVTGQQMAFAGRDLAQVAGRTSPVFDAFDQWAAERNRLEDQSLAARYIPRDVVGYQQLDAYGVWGQDPGYGVVWYPRVTVADWAPYRYGHWDWIAPWGWTWIDDAPWGFAPFHYGRWAQIGSRWAWVPGRLGPRPVYSPALVVFIGGQGGGANWSLSIGAGPGIAWFPLAPGEAWRPTYRASPLYVRNVNRYLVVNPAGSVYHHQRRPDAITGVRLQDFNRGRPVNRVWNRVNPGDLARTPIHAQPLLPEPSRRIGDAGRGVAPRVQPPVQQAPVQAQPRIRPQPPFQPPAVIERGAAGDNTARPGTRQRDEGASQQQQQQQERERARRDLQGRQVLEQQRAAREQQVQRENAQREQGQRENAQRQQAQRENAQREQAQRENALRQQQAAQERVQRQQEREQQRAVQQPPREQRAAPAQNEGRRGRGPQIEERAKGGDTDDRAKDRPNEDRGKGRGQRDVN